MIKENRYKEILATLDQFDSVSYQSLATKMDVSEDTIRRDIDYLHQNGLLSKVRGGAIPRDKNPLAFSDRADFYSSEKEIIGLKAQGLLKKGITIFMDGGTTVCSVAEHFSSDSSFRVITNNIALVPILSKFKGIETIILGGEHNIDTQTTIGAKTCQDAELFVADLYLMGSCGISKEFGITAAVQGDGAVKRSMLKSAKKTALLGNSNKIGIAEPFKVCDLDCIQVLITELPANDQRLDEIRFKKLKII